MQRHEFTGAWHVTSSLLPNKPALHPVESSTRHHRRTPQQASLHHHLPDCLSDIYRSFRVATDLLCRTRPKHGTPPVRSPACPCLHVRSGLLHPQSSRQCMSPLKRRRVGCGKLASCVTPQTSEFSLFCLLTWPRPTLPPCHMHTQSSWSYATRAFGELGHARRLQTQIITSFSDVPEVYPSPPPVCAEHREPLLGKSGGGEETSLARTAEPAEHGVHKSRGQHQWGSRSTVVMAEHAMAE